MQAIRVSILVLLIAYQATCFLARADVTELVGGLDTGHFIEGVNLTGNQLSASLAGEWSANSGAFATLSCFISENENRLAIQRGCDASLGWFAPVNESNAVTLEVSQHDYSSPVLSGWEYTDASVSWHLGKRYMVKLKASDSLLGQGFSAVTTSFHLSQPLNDKWRVKFEGGLTSLQNAAPVDSLEYGLLSAEYGSGRWATELKVMFSSSDYRRFVKLDLDQPEISLNFRYRMY